MSDSPEIPPSAATPARSRRDVALLVLGGSIAASLGVFRLTGAKGQSRVRRIGFLINPKLNDPLAISRLRDLKERLEKLGWREGKDITYEVRSTGGDLALAPGMAKELIELAPDVILAGPTPIIAIVVAATRTIPIVFATTADPVGAGFVESLARPGRNVTGFTNSHAYMGEKWLEYLKELAPAIRRVGVMFSPKYAPRGGKFFFDPMRDVASSFGVELSAAPFEKPEEIDGVVAAMSGDAAGGFVLPPDGFTYLHRAQIIEAAARHGVPAIYPFNYFTTEGGLMSYGPELEVREAEYVDLILRGASPADLPVQSPRRYNLLINLKTAKALGLEIPAALLVRADQVVG